MQMLDQSCRLPEAWREQGLADENLSISVNLSARQLGQADLADQIGLHRTPRPAAQRPQARDHRSTLVTRKELAISQLGKLRAKGLKSSSTTSAPATPP
jgi:EAL domain-containing protein (putative c-di-GMP-specific phosphodiesterase class I)